MDFGRVKSERVACVVAKDEMSRAKIDCFIVSKEDCYFTLLVMNNNEAV